MSGKAQNAERAFNPSPQQARTGLASGPSRVELPVRCGLGGVVRPLPAKKAFGLCGALRLLSGLCLTLTCCCGLSQLPLSHLSPDLCSTWPCLPGKCGSQAAWQAWAPQTGPVSCSGFSDFALSPLIPRISTQAH